MKKVSHKQFEIAVRKARAYVNNYDKVRWKICDIALSVCDPRKGGKKDQVFTLKKFAEEIELSSHTLYQWCRVKRLVFDKLPANVKQKISSYSYNDLDSVSLMVTENSSMAQVHQALKTILEVPPENAKFTRYYERDLSCILYNAQRPILMMNVDKEIIEKMMKRCDLISSLLKKELELRNKYSKEERVNKNLKQRKDALNDAKSI